MLVFDLKFFSRIWSGMLILVLVIILAALFIMWMGSGLFEVIKLEIWS